MFVTRRKHNQVVEELEMLKASVADMTRTIENKSTRNAELVVEVKREAVAAKKLRNALESIKQMETARPNGTTVKIMRLVEKALKDS